MKSTITAGSLLILVGLAAFALVGGAAADVRDHREGHWTLWPDLLDTSSGFSINPRLKYRLVTTRGQLAFSSLRGIKLTNTVLNVKIERALMHPEYGEVADLGAYVRLNEAIAIREDRGRYLVCKGEGIGLGWQRESHFNLANAPEVYQWQFRTLPSGNVRDHTRREITTGETLALYNVVKKAYLIYDPGKRALAWREN